MFSNWIGFVKAQDNCVTQSELITKAYTVDTHTIDKLIRKTQMHTHPKLR